MIKQRNIGHMPFAGHRTQKEVRLDEEIGRGLRRLSRRAREAA